MLIIFICSEYAYVEHVAWHGLSLMYGFNMQLSSYNSMQLFQIKTDNNRVWITVSNACCIIYDDRNDIHSFNRCTSACV